MPESVSGDLHIAMAVFVLQELKYISSSENLKIEFTEN